MRTRAICVLVAGLLCISPGCIGLDFSRDAVAPGPSQWEYLTVQPDPASVSFASTGGLQTDSQLSQLGSEGWELVAVNDGAYILKRPKAK